MTAQQNTGPGVTGLGGVFYAVRDPQATRDWYRDTLGITGLYGPQLDWAAEPLEHPYSLISPLPNDAYIQPGKGGFMINLRVHDLAGFVAMLRGKGVEILGEAEEGYGRFAWLLDPDGVKIELWEQVEDALP